MSRLCVNVDHVATLREARKTVEPDPLEAAALCEKAGVAGITIHLREDRRHIQDRDLEELRARVTTMLNLEMAATDEMVGIALRRRPDQVTLVPEKREEVTTEGGLDAAGHEGVLKEAIAALQGAGIPVSLFIDPVPDQIEASSRVGAQLVELHTGRYANASGDDVLADGGRGAERELRALVEEAAHAQSLGLVVNAGHGLNYDNVVAVAAIEGMHELNIGHSIISRAVIVGIERAVREMLELVADGTAQGPLTL
ncbi:MAG TPA: pyridoxine 5'-phosphate synthase [Sumerlaeia bacterium]|nr:pyridoxine 5'-phosphate synthase [Sumerlaeia bacterium]